MSKIVFFFLGNIINNKEISEHWSNCIKKINTKNKLNTYFCFNVINQEDKERKSMYLSECGINDSNILFVENFNTEKQTASIADNILLMMQYSILTLKAKNIKKILVLSEHSCPIYDINYIINEIIYHSKSYICGYDIENLNTQTLISHFKDLPYTNQKYYFNETMILDINHIKYFFLDSTLQLVDPKPTYIIKNKYICGSTLKTLSIAVHLNEENKLKELYELFNSYKHENTSYCYPVHEQLFGNFIIKKINEEAGSVLNSLKITSTNIIKNNIKLNRAAYAQLYDRELLNNYNLNLHNDISHAVNISESNISIKIGLIKSYITDRELYPCACGYIDISKISINPFDLYNNYLYEKISWSDFSDLIKTSTPEELQIKLTKNPLVKITFPPLSSVENPITYSSWSARDMVNMLLILRFIDSNTDTSNFKIIHDKYLSILTEYGIVSGNDDIKLLINKDDIKYIKNNFGNKILPDDIIISRAMGCLFIDNCKDGSGINEYSQILLETPESHIKKVINDIIIRDLPQYGLSFSSFIDFTEFIKKYHVKKEEHIKFFTKEKISEFLSELESNLAKGIFYTTNKLRITNSHINKNFTIGNQLGKGGWNVAYKLVDDDNLSKTLVLRHFFYNPMYEKPIEQNLKTSFFDNYSNILLTIIQKNIFNFEFVNNCVMMGIDENLDTKTSKYIFTINEKADMSCWDYLINMINFSKPKFLDMTIDILTKLLFMQKTIKFMHYDLHLENIFCSYQNDVFTPFISDLGTSEFTINGYRYKGNPEFDRSSIDEGYYNYGKDVVYYFISTIKKIYRYILDFETEYEENIIDILVWIFILFSYCITDETAQYYITTFSNNIEFFSLVCLGNIDKISKYVKNKLLADKDKRKTYKIESEKAIKSGTKPNKEEDYVKTIIDERAIFNINYDYKEFDIENIIPNIMEQFNLSTNIHNSNYYKKYLKYKSKYLKYKKKN